MAAIAEDVKLQSVDESKENTSNNNVKHDKDKLNVAASISHNLPQGNECEKLFIRSPAKTTSPNAQYNTDILQNNGVAAADAIHQNNYVNRARAKTMGYQHPPSNDKEGNTTSRTALLRHKRNTFETYNVPDFKPPYTIEQQENVTKITIHKRQCCNKMLFTLIICLFMLALYFYFLIMSFIWYDLSEGGWIMIGFFGLAAVILLLAALKSISGLCQYPQTKLVINKQTNVIQMYEPKIRYLYGNERDSSINYAGLCGCHFQPKITTICFISDFQEVVWDQWDDGKVFLKFIDMYSRKGQYYVIKESGKYADFTACQHLNYVIKENMY